MKSNSVSLNNVILNLNKNIVGELSLNAGEVLRGEVKEVLPNNRVSILLQGKLIEAFTEVKVDPGQKLFLMVEGLREGKTYLKVINPAMMKDIENGNLARTLIAIGLPAKAHNLEIARKLIQFQMPVNSENILAMEKNINILGNDSSLSLDIAAFSLRKGISNPEDIKNLGLFIKQGDISSSILNLDKVLQALAQELAKTRLDTKMSSHNQLEIESLINNSDTKANLNNPEIQNLKTIEGLGKLLQLLHDTLCLDRMSEPVIIKQQLLNRIQFDGGAAHAFEIVDKLAQDEDLVRRFPMIRQISEQLKSLQQELSGQRLFNISNKENLTDVNSIYLSFPVKYEEEYRLCQLKIKKDFSGNEINSADSMQIIVALNTEKMGLVLFHTDWDKRKYLKIQGIVQNEAVGNFVNQNMGSLIERLQSAGYVVYNLGVKVSQDGESLVAIKPDLSGSSVNKISPFKTFRIDIKI